MDVKEIHIWFVDDDEDERLFFSIAASAALPEFDVKVMTLNDGVLLLEHLSENSIKLPYILFLDINMPRKTGLECLKEIRDQLNFKDLPIVIYTTSKNEMEMQTAKEYGADMFIVKPTSLSRLKEIIRHALSIDWTGRNESNRQFILLGI